MKKKPAIPFRQRNVDWPINVDLLPVLSLQAQLDSKQELYGLKALVSEGKAQIKDKKYVSDLKFEVKTIPGVSTKTVVNWGSSDPKDQTRVTQKELWKEIVAQIAVPEAVIQSRGTVNDIPPKLADKSVFEGADEIYSSEARYGNRAKQLRERLKIHVSDPFEMIRYELLTRNIVPTAGHQVFKRIRSVLATEYLFPNNGVGYDSLFLIGRPLQRELRGNKFWKDTGIPRRIYGDINSHRIEAVLYQLEARSDKILAF